MAKTIPTVAGDGKTYNVDYYNLDLIDDERLKNGGNFGKDYFDELLERIREIRASERRFYQKLLIYIKSVV